MNKKKFVPDPVISSLKAPEGYKKRWCSHVRPPFIPILHKDGKEIWYKGMIACMSKI